MAVSSSAGAARQHPRTIALNGCSGIGLPHRGGHNAAMSWLKLFLVLSLCLLPASLATAAPVSLFDGRTLDGWDYDPKIWWVEDGMITGGSRTEKIPANYFIATKRSFQNFALKLKIKCGGDPATGFINSGIQIRSVRVPGGTHMSGYQVDCGKGWFGKIYDEYRRNRVIAEPVDAAALEKVVDVYGWNEYRIRAEGPRIRVWINGVLATDFTETDKNIALDGQIGPQVHSGGACLVQFKDVTIEELPPTPGAPTWESLGGVEAARKLAPPAPKAAPQKAAPKKAAAAPETKATKTGRDISYNAVTDGPRSPEQERQAFTLPDGFEVELVAAESEGIGKFISVAFDAQGRLWTMTALEYPVDANENKAASDALFAKGGRDKVVVWDNPYGASASGPAKPRVFADGLVMPLGLLPHKDGVFVQYGVDIRFYRDTNGDGKADKHDVVLTGFGTQDSHLFPHQFTRTPGNYILAAQGLFNYSTVRRPDGGAFADGAREVVFNQCKLARFTPDGSMFENLTSGPNNIWGLTISREGETWVQEANDIGQPIIPFEPGAYYRTGSKDRLRPYQPLMPPTLDPPQMGGTGLSGLALADDKFGWPAPWGLKGAPANAPRYFYVANPITSRINLIRATPENGRYRYEKLPDFLVSSDPWFRPVAIQFGPDDCLYIVDWYNKIISHNEVPRTHPDRDKTRGRIWRIRHKEQPRRAPANLAKLADKELLAHLGAANARIADLAWQEIVDRKAIALASDLTEIASDKSSSADRRLGALWALEGIAKVPSDLLTKLAQDDNANVRREAVRIAALHLPPSEFVKLASPLVDDPSPRVRAALGDGLRRVSQPVPGVIALAARLGKAPLTGAGEWDKYDREFERYLARWAMELHPQAVAAFLDSTEGRSLPLENRLLATLSLGGKDAATGLARLMPELQRPLEDEEVRALAANFNEPAVGDALKHALSVTGSRARTLRALLNLRTSLDTAPLAGALTDAARALLASEQSPDVSLGVEAAGAFQLASLEPDLVRVLQRGMGASRTPPNQPVLQPQSLAALQSLANLRSGEIELFEKLVAAGDGATRDAAILALASSRHEQGPLKLAGMWPNLPPAARPKVVESLTASKPGAQALLASLKSGQIPRDEIGVPALERMHTLLAGDAAMEQLWRELAGSLQRVLRLKGGNDDYVAQPVTLTGPFTVEAWVKLAPNISNHDGILGAPGVLDLNFHASQFRVWVGGGQHDVVVAKRKTTPETWTHYAVTRDAQGVFRIYLNGELDATSTQRNTNAFAGLNIGRTIPTAGGTDGWLAEYRIWSVARSAEEIRDNFDRLFAEGRDALPRVQTASIDLTRTRSSASLTVGLVHHFSGDTWGKLNGKAVVEATLEAPVLLTEAQARAQAEKFAQFRSQADKAGNAATGRELFTTLCLTCHQQGGKGGQIAPALDGLANTGVEAILRNVLTPNAAMEGGYRKYRVETKDGELLEGLLVSENEDAIVLRQPNVADQRVPRANVKRAGFTNTSLMPEGLLEGLQPAQVSDLFSYLKTLK